MYESVEVEQHRSVGPSALHGLLEPPRMMSELCQLAWSWPALETTAPRGDGHTVLVLPGFMGGDSSTEVLRLFLRRLGYSPRRWGLGTNTGQRQQQQQLAWRFVRMSARANRPISLIGQSLGGVYARELARQFPSAVRQVITLGSPFGMQDPGGTSPMVRALFEQLSGQSVDDMREHVGRADASEPLPMPSTAVYSRSDGVVHWSACRQNADARSENIEVRCSHVGMAVHPAILHVIADRLAQPADDWRPFDRSRGLRRFFVSAED